MFMHNIHKRSVHKLACMTTSLLCAACMFFCHYKPGAVCIAITVCLSQQRSKSIGTSGGLSLHCCFDEVCCVNFHSLLSQCHPPSPGARCSIVIRGCRCACKAALAAAAPLTHAPSTCGRGPAKAITSCSGTCCVVSVNQHDNLHADVLLSIPIETRVTPTSTGGCHLHQLVSSGPVHLLQGTALQQVVRSRLQSSSLAAAVHSSGVISCIHALRALRALCKALIAFAFHMWAPSPDLCMNQPFAVIFVRYLVFGRPSCVTLLQGSAL